MSVMMWSYAMAVRAKNSAGSVICTYLAGRLDNGMVGNATVIPKMIGPPTYEKVELQREAFDYSESPVVLGFRPRVTVQWEQRSAGIIGLTSASFVSGGWTFWITNGVALQTVLSALSTNGNWLEVSLDGGSTWRSVNLDSQSVDYKPVEGKAVACSLELAFSGRRLIASVPDLAPASWGTAS
jgi:hypothetical protein